MANAIGSVAEESVQLASLALPGGVGQGTQDFLAASGVLKVEEVYLQQGFYHLTLPADTQDDLPTGPYRIELRNADGNTLSTRSFGPDTYGDAEPGEEGTFHLFVPWVDGTHAVVIQYNGREIGRWESSPSVPSVTLITPNGGEQWDASGTFTISWQANDPDGDSLTYSLQYSPDGGQTWLSIVPNTNETKWETDLAYIPGSDRALVRVLAHDGMNTSQDASDATFTVAPKAPLAHIAFPEDGATYPQVRPLIMQAYATDLEDGPISDPTAFVWNSSRDGELGQGTEILSTNLSPGRHKITISVRDSSGAVGRDEITIVIGAGGDQFTPPKRSSVVLVLAALVLVAGLLILWLVIYVLVPRFRSPGHRTP
jgi:hypothetical protein